MAFQSANRRSASIGGGGILTPSGTLSELFEDGDAPNQAYRHDRLRIFLTSEMRIRCKSSSDGHQQQLCHHVYKRVTVRVMKTHVCSNAEHSSHARESLVQK